MGKRKGSLPQKVEAEKRKNLSWNMLDGLGGGFLSVLPDSSILEEPTHPNMLLPDINREVTADPHEPSKQFSSHVDHLFQSQLDYCLFYVTIRDRLQMKDSDWSCEIGRFDVQLSSEPSCLDLPQSSLPQCEEYWLYVGEEGHRSMMYFELCHNDEKFHTSDCHDPEKKCMFWFASVSLPITCLQALQVKAFQVIQGKFDVSSQVLELIIHAKDSVLLHPKFASEYVRPNKVNQAISILMEHFYGFKPTFNFDGLHKTEQHDIESLFEAIKKRHKRRDITLPVDVQHPCLKPVLRSYQRQAVCWMLNQERYCQTDATVDPVLHSLYSEVTMNDGKVLYYNKHAGILVTKYPLMTELPPGGLLADEMGLGKTVEVLSCVLLHPRTDLQCPVRLPTVNEIGETVDPDLGKLTVMGLKHYDIPQSERNEHINTRENCQMEDVDKNCFGKSILDENPVMEDKDWTINEKPEVEGDRHISDGTVCVTASDLARSGSQKVDPDKESVSVMMETCDIVQSPLRDQEDVTEQPSHLVNDVLVSPSGYSCEHEKTANIQAVNVSHATYGEVSDKCLLGLCDQQDDRLENTVSVARGPVKNHCPPSTTYETAGITCPEIGHSAVASTDPLICNVTDVSSPCGQTSIISSLTHVTTVMNTSQMPCDVDRQASAEKPEREKCLTVRKRKKKMMTFGKKRKRSPLSPTTDIVNAGNTDLCQRTLVKTVRKVRSRKFEILVEEKEFKPSTFFTESAISQKQWFECVCGGDKDDKHSKRKKLTSVQCVVCGMWQHAQCLHYDLNNPHRGRYKCPHCHVTTPPVQSGATLIISPFAICHQWEDEIQKHVRKKALRVFIYTGVNKQGFIQPQTLADFDIVITTYETLRKEIDYVDLPHCNSSSGRRFRHRKRFMATPSPITAVEWWRICLDEAQMVECTTTKTAEMALRLSGVNRWCVTGTPIQKSVKDLYGLLLFLGMDPYWVEMWWTKLLYVPFCHGFTEPMYNTLSQVLWRTAKKDVLNQIMLPPQTQEIHWLTFSPVEDHFYRRQYRDCVKEAFQRLNKWKDNSVKLNSMDRHTMSQLLHPLLRLRQACCHPQAVRGEFLPLNKNTMTMDELLESLTKKAKVESEESHRQLVAATNGLAALYIIKQQYSEAVDAYRQVLRSVSEHSDRLGTDDLQQLHALHNLHEILSIKPDNIHPTLRDHQLKTQAEELSQKYMLKAAGKVTAAQHSLLPVQQAVQEAKAECDGGWEWWSDLLEVMVQRGLDRDLVEKVREDIEAQSNPEAGLSMASSFHNIRGLEYCIYTHLTALESSHGQLVKSVKKLSDKPKQAVVNQTVECCLRPVKESLRICLFCKTDELFNAHEAKLFSFRERGMHSAGDGKEVLYQVNTKRQGTWADSDVEKALKSILSFCRHHGVPHHYKDMLETGAAHIKMLDAMKKEFKYLRTVWLAAREQVSSVDELDMATTRLRLRLPDEPQSDTPQPNILEREEVETHRMKLVADKANAEAELRKKLGQLLYLTNLAKSQEEKADGSNPDPCPVCQKRLGVEWSVLLCGHCYCLDCIRIMVEQYSFGGRNRSMKCAMCRQATHHSDISYVSTKKQTGGGTGEEKVVGSYSTKVEAIVSCIKNIHKKDPTAKTLIFSTWHDVLDVVGKALHQNGCEYRALYAPGKFQQYLKAFKESEIINTLLIPFRSGANGLNLIEATHILLVEPILNPAEELQAIGRVHRIGQTRPTHVHKFLVRGTIEQRIHNLVKSHSSVTPYDGEDNTMTIGDLASLFTDVSTEKTPESWSGQSGETVADTDASAPGSSTDIRYAGVDSPLPGTSGVDTDVSLADTSTDNKHAGVDSPLPETSGVDTDVSLADTSTDNKHAGVDSPLPETSGVDTDVSLADTSTDNKHAGVDSPLPGTSGVDTDVSVTDTSAQISQSGTSFSSNKSVGSKKC